MTSTFRPRWRRSSVHRLIIWLPGRYRQPFLFLPPINFFQIVTQAPAPCCRYKSGRSMFSPA